MDSVGAGKLPAPPGSPMTPPPQTSPKATEAAPTRGRSLVRRTRRGSSTPPLVKDEPTEGSLPVSNVMEHSIIYSKSFKEQPKRKRARSVSFASMPPEISEKRARGPSKQCEESEDEDSEEEDDRARYVSYIRTIYSCPNGWTRIPLATDASR